MIHSLITRSPVPSYELCFPFHSNFANRAPELLFSAEGAKYFNEDLDSLMQKGPEARRAVLATVWDGLVEWDGIAGTDVVIESQKCMHII